MRWVARAAPVIQNLFPKCFVLGTTISTSSSFSWGISLSRNLLDEYKINRENALDMINSDLDELANKSEKEINEYRN